MTAANFKYWLQGWFEIGGASLTKKRLKVVQAHLDIVEEGDDFTEYLQTLLNTFGGERLSSLEAIIQKKLNDQFEHEVEIDDDDDDDENMFTKEQIEVIQRKAQEWMNDWDDGYDDFGDVLIGC